MRFSGGVFRIFLGWAAISALVLGMAVTIQVYAATETDSLEAYWKFDETSQGSDAADSSGDSHTGLPFGTGGGPNFEEAAPSTSFPNTRSAEFNGTDQFLVVPDHAELNTTTFTIAMWVKFDALSGAYRTLVGKWHVGVKEQYLVQLNNNNRIAFWTGNGTSGGATNLESTLPLSADTWYHVTAIVEGTSKRLYINGTDNSYSHTGTAPGASDIELTIGSKRSNGGSYFEFLNGNLDDLRFYDRALSEEEIDMLAAGEHISATWTGSTSTDPEVASNWSNNVVPDPYQKWVIPATENPVILTSDMSTTGIEVEEGGTLNQNCFEITFLDDGELDNQGTVEECEDEEPSPSPSPTPEPASTPTTQSQGPTPTAPSCTDRVPSSVPDLFQINRVGDTALLYFTPVSGAVEKYHVVYGYIANDERFGQVGAQVSVESNTGVQSITIQHLDPNATYWFQVMPVNGCAVGERSNWLEAKRVAGERSIFYRWAER